MDLSTDEHVYTPAICAPRVICGACFETEKLKSVRTDPVNIRNRHLCSQMICAHFDSKSMQIGQLRMQTAVQTVSCAYRSSVHVSQTVILCVADDLLLFIVIDPVIRARDIPPGLGQRDVLLL